MKKVVFIGHVDTGKSTLLGHILYKNGYITEHELDKIQTQAIKEKMGRWKWARILDIYEEEMTRGKTHEYVEIEINLNGEKVSLIDTPGHQSFVREMINGISCQVKSAIVMVSMIDNEFEASFNNGMLKEHILLSRCAGINNYIIVANKMDAINWDEKKMRDKLDKVYKYLKTIGCSDEKIKSVPLDSYEGIGINSLDRMPDWYSGNDLFKNIENLPTPKNEAFIKEEKTGNMILANFTLFKVPEMNPVISAGFTGIIHYGGYGNNIGKETEVEIYKIEKSVMIKTMETKKIVFSMDKSIDLGIKSRIILRHGNDTLGYGTVLNVKNRN